MIFELHRRPIRTQLRLLVLLFGLSTTAVLMWQLYGEYQRARAEAYAKARIVADGVAANIGNFLQEKEADLALITKRPQVRALDPERCDPFMPEYVRMRPALAGFTVRDLSGNVVCTMSPSAFTGAQISELGWFQRAVKSEKFSLGAAFVRPGNARWAATMNYPIYDAAGKRAAVGILPLDLSGFSKAMMRSVPSSALVFVADGEAKVALRSTDVEKWVGRAVTRAFTSHAEGRESATFQIVGATGVPRLYAMVRVPGTDWQVYAGLEEEQVMAPYRETLRTGALLSTLWLLLMLWLASRIAGSVLRPIHALAQTANQLGSGNMSARAPLDGPDEVVAVARSFNQMAQARGEKEAVALEQAAWFRVLTEVSGAWYWEQDTDFRYTKFEGRDTAMVEGLRATWLGKTRWDAHGTALTPADWAAHRALLEAHQPFYDLRNRRQLDETSPAAWYTVSGVPMFGVGGQFRGYCGMARDITKEVTAEEERRSLEAQLRESQKMEAVGTLAGGIAHDFNNILAAILGNAALAQQDATGNHAVQESLTEIRKAGTRGRDLVRQILSFSRRQPTDRKPLDLSPLLRESVNLLRATLSPLTNLQLEVAADLPQVMADGTQLQQVVLNLVSNASQALHGKAGLVRIRADLVELNVPEARDLPPLKAGRYVRLAVQDSGAGMDEATQAHIFEPFFTTKPTGEGTGLGLSVVHGIVSGHDGAIKVESAPGAGSTFTCYLPALEASLNAGNEAAEALPPPAPSGQRVLYVDDDQSILFLVKRLLERQGFSVTAMHDQKAAIELVRVDAAAFDLIVTDYNMPGMSGLDLAREIRKIRATLPVALASGFITDELRGEAATLGIRDLIFKPNAVEEFCQVIQRLVPGKG